MMFRYVKASAHGTKGLIFRILICCSSHCARKVNASNTTVQKHRERCHFRFRGSRSYKECKPVIKSVKWVVSFPLNTMLLKLRHKKDSFSFIHTNAHKFQYQKNWYSSTRSSNCTCVSRSFKYFNTIWLKTLILLQRKSNKKGYLNTRMRRPKIQHSKRPLTKSGCSFSAVRISNLSRLGLKHKRLSEILKL